MNKNKMETKQYLKKAEKINEESILKVIGFFKNNKDDELERIIKLDGFNKSSYLSDETNFIIKETRLKEFEKIIHTFCYAVNQFRREQKEQEEIDNIQSKYTLKIDISDKDLDGKKVEGSFEIEKIEMLGSFSKFEELTGKLVYLEQYKRLMIIPKGKRTRGNLINRGFIKE